MSSRPYTGEHPPASAPDATQISKGQVRTHDDGLHLTFRLTCYLQPSPAPSPSAELASLKIRVQSAIRQFPDFPEKGILFEDILPIFADAQLFEDLIRALELHIVQSYGVENKPDIIVGLEARGFLFAPTLALRLGCGFVPIRKKGKLPGPTTEVAYEKEYGKDYFAIQSDAVKPGQKVLVLDDILATGET